DPPRSLIDRLSRRFIDTEGDLKEVSKSLITAPEAWDAAPTKLRRPSEWLVGALRVSGIKPPDVRPTLQAQNLLGEPLWRAPAPNGFSDDSAAWMDGLVQRLDIANQIARRVSDTVDPEAVAQNTFSAFLSKETKDALARAENRSQALALLFMAPEFQRRGCHDFFSSTYPTRTAARLRLVICIGLLPPRPAGGKAWPPPF